MCVSLEDVVPSLQNTHQSFFDTPSKLITVDTVVIVHVPYLPVLYQMSVPFFDPPPLAAVSAPWAGFVSCWSGFRAVGTSP